MMTCLIVDDEKPARDLLEDNVNRVSFLSLAGTCRSAFETIGFLQHTPVDLLFLDIKMPGISGMELSRTLQNPPLIILVTAFDHHAVEAFKLNVVDYLLKPVTFERFFMAATKAYDLFTLKQRSRPEESQAYDHFFVNAGYSLVKVKFQEITSIEGMGDYVKIHLTSPTPVITRLTMKDLSDKLAPDQFMRVHKSFIISLNNIEAVQKYKVVVAGQEIPVGDSYRETLQQYIAKRNV